MGQVGSKLRPRWAMMAPRWPSRAQFGSFLEGPGTTCGHFFRDLCKNGRSVKTNNNTTALWVVFWVGASSGGSWRLSWERFEGYVGRWRLQDGVVLAILGDVWTSWRQGWRTRAQDAADDRKSWIFGGLEGGGGDAGTRAGSRAPPRKKFHRKGLELPPAPGAPNSTWKLVELKLWMELFTDQDTQHVPEGTPS